MNWGAARGPWLTLSVALAALALFALGVSPRELGYAPDRPDALRLLTCHLAHYDRLHLAWDVATFALLGALTERLQPARHAWFVALGAASVAPVACAFTPWVARYAGLSGLVLGQLALLLACGVREAIAARSFRPAAAFALALAALVGKQIYECQIGSTSVITMPYTGFRTVPAAHLYGVLLGAAAGGLGPIVRRGAPVADLKARIGTRTRRA